MDVHLGPERVSPKETLAVREGCRAVSAATNLVVSCNPKALAWWDDLIFKTMWSSTVKNADTLHCKELRKVLVKI